jgi:hypothetical protein
VNGADRRSGGRGGGVAERCTERSNRRCTGWHTRRYRVPHGILSKLFGPSREVRPISVRDPMGFRPGGWFDEMIETEFPQTEEEVP